MCGLYGCFTRNMTLWEIDNVIDLAAINVGRGKDSTGVAAILDKCKVEMVKGTLNPVSFWDHENVRQLIKKRPMDGMMGHNRLATIGDKNQANAHPFRHGSIVGMHNGTVKNFEPHKKDQHNTTDSKLLIKHLAEHGLQSVVDHAGTDGAMALVWVDEELKTLNFYRNWHRPLHYMFSSGGTVMYWSSEKEALKLLDARDKMVFQEVMEFKTETHYWIEVEQGKLELKSKPIDGPCKFKYKPVTAQEAAKALNKKEDKKKEPTRPTKEGTYPNRSGETTPVTTGQITLAAGEKPTTIVHLPPKSTSEPLIYQDIIRPGDWYKGFRGRVWTIKDTVDRLKSKTCELCNKQPTIFEKVHWIDDDSYVCNEHINDVRILTNETWEGCIKKGH